MKRDGSISNSNCNRGSRDNVIGSTGAVVVPYNNGKTDTIAA